LTLRIKGRIQKWARQLTVGLFTLMLVESAPGTRNHDSEEDWLFDQLLLTTYITFPFFALLETEVFIKKVNKQITMTREYEL